MIKRKLVYTRRVSQFLSFVFFVYVLWSTTSPLQGKFSPEIFFKIDPLIMFLTALSERVFLPGLSLAALLLFLTFIFGRFFCGWLCPLGFLIDAWVGLKKRHRFDPSQRIRKIKYGVFGILVLCAAFGIQSAWVFDPIVTVARVISLNLIPSVTWGVDKVFVGLIQTFHWYGGFYDFYRGLKTSLLGVNVHFFVNSLATFLFFLAILGAGWFLPRFWCRVLCPLGAMLAISSWAPFLRREVENCKECGRCQRNCRMGAIKKDADYVAGECILCLDCVYDCAVGKTRFSFVRREKVAPAQRTGISRRSFLFLLSSAVMALGIVPLKALGAGMKGNRLIRPPGVDDEDSFLNTCVRCGNCMKVCMTNGLQPSLGEAGWQGLWTPQLVPEIGYCEYNCTLCGHVCPTGAIPRLPLADKHLARLGLAEVDRPRCLAWAQNKECIVCEEHCPVPQKAIKTEVSTVDGRKIFKPVVDPRLCIGCGICQNKCPVTPIRAIRVNPSPRG